MMCEQLKPCPICGGKGRTEQARRGWYVKCLDCGVVFGDVNKEDATGCFEAFDTEQEAINAWNAEKEIKPCPFCGEEEDLAILPDLAVFSVNCESCGAVGPTAESSEGAIDAWNRRPAMTEKPKPSVHSAGEQISSLPPDEGDKCMYWEHDGSIKNFPYSRQQLIEAWNRRAENATA